VLDDQAVRAEPEQRDPEERVLGAFRARIAQYSTAARSPLATGSPNRNSTVSSSAKACRAYARAPARPRCGSRNGCERKTASLA
jgi:hypothetical protein